MNEQAMIAKQYAITPELELWLARYVHSISLTDGGSWEVKMRAGYMTHCEPSLNHAIYQARITDRSTPEYSEFFGKS